MAELCSRPPHTRHPGALAFSLPLSLLLCLSRSSGCQRATKFSARYCCSAENYLLGILLRSRRGLSSSRRVAVATSESYKRSRWPRSSQDTNVRGLLLAGRVYREIPTRYPRLRRDKRPRVSTEFRLKR